MERLTGLIGLVAIVAAAYLFSSDRRAIQPRVVLWGLTLQFSFAFLVLKTPVARAFTALSGVVNTLLGYAEEGSKLVFGELGSSTGQFGVVLAFEVLPIVIFVAALFSVLYYLGIMQVFVRAVAAVMQRLMGVSGAEATSVAASIFMGQSEAPLTIRPFLAALTMSELFTIMTSGMAHISGATLAAYTSIAHVEARHLLTAVIMTSPATLMLAKMLMPETGKPVTAGSVKLDVERQGVNVIDAAAHGASDGLHLAINIAGMLIAFIGLVALMNGILHAMHIGTMQSILGKVFAPVAWMLGVKWNDCATIGNLLGTRLILNEFVAYVDLGKIRATLDPHSFTIATYALCGFANLGSIAVQVGGLGALVPSRKSDVARLGLKAMAAGTMANFMTACIAGILL